MVLKPEYSNAVSNIQVIQYKIDLVVKFLDRLVPGKPGGGLRGEITHWSRASIRRFMLMVKNSSCEWVGLITLTYPREYTADGKAVKKQLNSFLQYLRRLNCSYCWVLEFQKRGAPHFHILVSGFVPKDEVATRWFNIVGSGDVKHLCAGTRVEGVNGDKNRLLRYLFSYLKKADQKKVPDEYKDVGRWWGSTRSILREVGKIVLRCKEFEARKVLRIVRKYYERKIKSWGFTWKWARQRGFIGWECSAVWDRLLSEQNQIFKEVRQCSQC